MSTLSPFQSARQFIWPQARCVAPSDEQIVEQAQRAACQLRTLPDSVLPERTATLRDAVTRGESLLSHDVLLPAMALIQEAARRALGIELFDVQMLAGLALARGAVAEMQTGEGKTLAAMPAAFLMALIGKGVHVVTPNHYLAKRDFEQTSPAFRLLGLTVGLLEEGGDLRQKRAAYGCDITYATGYEVGFDYLRDQLDLLRQPKLRPGELFRNRLRGQRASEFCPRQRPLASAIIDEIDSVLIDEACLPLILSDAGPGEAADSMPYLEAIEAADTLRPEADYVLDGAERRVTLTERGTRSVYERHSCSASSQLARPWAAYVQQALQASLVLKRDVDYIVHDGKVMLVDELTGRIFADRSWRDGLHQAVEAKEGLTVTPERATAVRVSRQRFFRMYGSICGMTGTAVGSERELWNLYRLPVVLVPLRKPSRRSILPARYFMSIDAKWRAITMEVQSLRRTGRPILIGSRTIANSQIVAQQLRSVGIHCQVLNGKQDQGEAEIIARAGQRGAITIATNMAGRGTDIKLAPGVAELGGLHMIGVERHDSQRVDRQLIGRVGRQGEPGSCRFFVSAEDDLIVRYAPELGEQMKRGPGQNGEISGDFTAQVDRLQRQVEAHRYADRRRLLSYDRWLEELSAKIVKED